MELAKCDAEILHQLPEGEPKPYHREVDQLKVMRAVNVYIDNHPDLTREVSVMRASDGIELPCWLIKPSDPKEDLDTFDGHMEVFVAPWDKGVVQFFNCGLGGEVFDNPTKRFTEAYLDELFKVIVDNNKEPKRPYEFPSDEGAVAHYGAYQSIDVSEVS